MNTNQKKLSIVPVPHPQASILSPTINPALRGNDNEDLLCGKCSAILTDGVSENTIASRFAAPFQLLIKCPQCGIYNNLPAKVSS